MRSERSLLFQAADSKPTRMFGLELATRLIATKDFKKPNIYVRFLCLCAEHVRQLEGESPFHNLMEVK